MSDPKVSITIPCYKRPWQLRRCLESLAETEYENYEVICVIDGDSPESLEFAQGTVIVNGSHKGLARSIGAGWHVSTGDILIEVDQDTLFLDPLWLQRIVSAYQAFPFLGVVGLPVCPVYDSAKVWRSPKVSVRKLVRYGINGGVLSVSRSAFLELGYPWQGSEPVGGHDFEYTWRARWCKFKTGYINTRIRQAKQMTDAPEDAAYRKWVNRSKQRNTQEMRARIRKIIAGKDHYVPYQD